MAVKTGPVRDTYGTVKYRHELITVVLRVDPDQGLSVLMTKRPREPFTGMWALPSGPLKPDEDLDDSARRHLQRRCGITRLSHLEQLATRGAPHRDPADRTIATAYVGLLASDGHHDVHTGTWLAVDALRGQDTAFDHHIIVEEAVERLRAKLSYTNIGFALAGESFTMSQLRDIYVQVLGHKISSTNLHRILTRRGQLAETGEIARPNSGGGRPAKLFRFTTTTLEVTDPFAVLQPPTSYR